MNIDQQQNPVGLYRPEFEHDACGIGFRASLKGRKSHQIVKDAIQMLERMDHRGACGCDPNTGDGAGLLIQIPHEFFVNECTKQGVVLPPAGHYGVGMIFFPNDAKIIDECKDVLSRGLKKIGLELLGYRTVPTQNAQLGEGSLGSEPRIEQMFVKRPDGLEEEIHFERKLYVLRQYVSRIITQSVVGAKDFYFSSFSCRTISYKGQLTTAQLKYYFPDIEDESVVSSLAVVHSRFSTNTFPSWKLAQPFRFIAHNGEINTVKGNVNWIRAGERSFFSPYFTKEEMDMILPICDAGNSDSAMLDNVIELLYLTGRSLPHVMMMLVPEAWDGNDAMDEQRKAFYEYHACLMEPWDGPASISFTDGKMVGATLDRNGLRPSRYWVLDDDTVVMASEAGVLDIDQARVVKKGRLQPGKMFVVDMEQGRIVPDEEVKANVCSRQPYGEWLDEYKIKTSNLNPSIRPYHHYNDANLLRRQIAFGLTSEDLRMILEPMATTGKEALGSMGTDTPLAVLSDQSQHLSQYFKQLFAQVTNPPIDPIRERSIMSLISFVGENANLLDETPKHARLVELDQPILTIKEFDKLRFIDKNGFQAKTINTYFSINENGETLGQSLERALERICRYAEDAIYDGFEIVILSDRAIDSDHAPIPSLLATSAVHHYLIRKGLRGKVGILVEAGDVWESHHVATLLGYGAAGVCPYMVFETLSAMNKNGRFDGEWTDDKLYKNYVKAADGELLKIFSKMGISTLQSYQGAQIFEILGINSEVVAKYFTGSISRIGGMGIEEIAKEAVIKHKLGFEHVVNKRLEVGGIYQWKLRGEKHMFNPTTIHLLQQATRKNDYKVFKQYSKIIDDQTKDALTLRGLMKFKKRASIDISEVEPIENILTRFASGAMSFGSISWEAHTTLAKAMNRIGGKSNSGEGGEDEIRYELLPNGDNMNSRIKQVASGRFGVTSHYLSTADELQIKMAQGAKPGEGGQLPGHKVDEWIGRVRHSTPGVGLISPPPHHDIYSIEDLAQLIFDLKNSNRAARVSVKLVSEAGVGTVATGVAKAHADLVLISGFDGGTGASPISSIRHAGLPWELGLAETHQTLVRNKLRGRIAVQADGQIRTGKDIVVAALLGAEEFGVATAALVTMGCIMMRKCHLNTCPVGVATQDPHLRTLFSGEVEHVVNMYTFLAMEVREIMAELGFRTINEMVGQTDVLEMAEALTHWKYKNLDFKNILFKEPSGIDVALFKQEEQDHGLADQLDWKMIDAAKDALENGKATTAEFDIINVNRSVGTMISNEISKKYKGAGLPDDTITFNFRGTAGQSFGGFSTKGLKLNLEGDANDYFGKGLCGAQLAVYPDRNAKFVAADNQIIGNVAFYGATSGEAFINGMAGERFCVRNSGAKVVVEGVGDHGCEYMTGGLAIILGETGANFAAGMSGGVAYVFDESKTFKNKINKEMVELEDLDAEDLFVLKNYVEKHLKNTNSPLAANLLQNWASETNKFVKVMPTDYKRVLAEKKQKQTATA